MIVTLVIIIIALIFLLVYINASHHEMYWKKRGVVFYKKYKLAGPFWEYLFQERAMFEFLHDIYKEYPDAPAIGLGSIIGPALYVRDSANVNHVLQTDFQSFDDRGLAFHDNDTLANNILLLHGPKWKILRQNLTPLFTTAKMKNMYYIVDKSARDFAEYLQNNPTKLKCNGIQNLNTFCCAAISAAVFGVGITSTFDSPFVQIVKDALQPTSWKNLKFAMAILVTPIFKSMRMSLFSVHEEWFIGAIKKVIRQREQDMVENHKHDFAELCVNIQRKGTMRDSETGYELEPTDEVMAAQAFFFYLAGLDPCAAVFYNSMIELGRNADILSKVHKEIDELFEKYNNDNIPYDAIVGMQYLEKVINESLRMYPPIGFLTRQCVKDTVLPTGNIKVETGTKIFTPIYEYQHDSQYFENPEVFDPERFPGDENTKNMYNPFGKGKRICIGIKYGKLQVKAGIVHVLRHFTVKTHLNKGGIRFSKEQLQVRLKNVDFEFIPRTNFKLKIKT